MKLLRLLWATSHQGLLVAIVLGFVSGLAGVAEVALINNGITGQTSLSTTYFLQLTGLLVLVYAATLVSKAALIRLTEQAYYNLQLRLARQLLAAPLSQIETIGQARLLAMLAQDNDNIASFFNRMPLIVLHGSIITACIIYLYILSPALATLLLLVMVPSVFIYAVIIRRGRRWMILSRSHSEKLFDQYRALTEGAKELKQNQPRRASFFYELFEPISALYRRYRSNGRVWHEVGNVWSQILFFVYVVVMLYVSNRTGMSSTHVLTGFALTALYIRSSVASIVQAVPTYQSATVALAAIERLRLPADDAAAQINRDQRLQPAASWQGLELAGVSYAYYDENEGKSFEVGPLDLRFQSGELAFIVGGNGSGKTTLLKLLCGLYTPDSGAVRFDGQQVTDANIEAYRQNFSALFADFYLFDDLLGLDSPAHQQLARDYLARLRLENKVQIEEGRLSTSKLSFGQRKRLALLTAYLEDRPIYVFDEWAAGQDPSFSDIFYQQILPDLQRQGKLVIVVSHDDHYYHLAGRLIKMEHGQIEYDQVVNAGPGAYDPLHSPSAARNDLENRSGYSAHSADNGAAVRQMEVRSLDKHESESA